MSVRSFLIAGLMMAIGGCTQLQTEAEWDCPLTSAASCQSVAEADRGGRSLSSHRAHKHATRSSQPNHQTPITTIPIGSGSSALRAQERVGRIWLAPFVDSAGRRYGPGWVYVVEQPGRWLSQWSPYESQEVSEQ